MWIRDLLFCFYPSGDGFFIDLAWKYIVGMMLIFPCCVAGVDLSIAENK